MPDTKEPRYKFVDEPDSKGRPQHIHTLDGQPLYGTSTVLNVLAKPLTWWASGLACQHLGWTNPKIPNSRKRTPMEDRMTPAYLERHEQLSAMPPEEFMGELDLAYKAHSVKLDAAAVKGTDMHAELERYVKDCIENHHGVPIPTFDEHDKEAGWQPTPVDLFAKWACYNVQYFVASEAYCYSERLWTGGIVDLVYMGPDGELALLDFKSAKEAYDAHFLQNAGYDIAISENGILTKDGELIERLNGFVKYGVLPFGMPEPRPQFRNNVDALKKGFESCVHLHKLFQKGDRNYG